MHDSVLQQILILLAASVVAVALFRRLRLPAILAYLGVGLAVGPHALGWIPSTDDTRFLAEFGVVFLLFTVGLEFSLPKLLAMRREVLGLGGMQVVLTATIVALLAHAWGMDGGAAVVVGGIFAMSSTAIVIKQLTEQLELNSRHGRNAVGILLFQDAAVPIFLILIPVLHEGIGLDVMDDLGWALLKGVLLVAGLLTFGRWVLRPLFREIARHRTAELFTLTTLLMALGAAWASHALGLSMAFGAFLAGMMLGETEFRHQVEADLRPFQSVLLGLFFVTIGMLLDLAALPAILPQVLLLLAAVVVGKLILITLLALLNGAGRGVALRTGVSLAHGGEFGFALLALALGVGLLNGEESQLLLATLILSMLLAPLMVRYNGLFAKRIFAGSYGANRAGMSAAAEEAAAGMSGHLLICGYGRIGQRVAHLAEAEGFEYVALDLDADRVREARAAGEPVAYGDATHSELLEAAGLERARALVISFDNPAAAERILVQVRQRDADLPLVVRTRSEGDLERLQRAGASEVVPEALESGLLLAAHLLLRLGTPITHILRQVQGMRGDQYRLMRAFFHGRENEAEEAAFRERLHAVPLPEGAHAVGRRLEEMPLKEWQVVVTAIRRDGIRGPQPEPWTRLRAGDTLVLYGAPEDLEHAESLLLRGR